MACVSPSSGCVFEKRIIEKYIYEHNCDPISNEPLAAEQLIEIKVLPLIAIRHNFKLASPAALCVEKFKTCSLGGHDDICLDQLVN